MDALIKQVKQLERIIADANKIVIVQADNPDADSLGSALALEHILGDLGKETFLYCGVDIPGYLRYLEGWDRVSPELPKTFDASIIVDASTLTLLEKLIQSGQKSWLASKPCIVIDHHETVDNPIDFAQLTIKQPNRASTGEQIYLLATDLGWKMSVKAQEYITASILGDTQGLSNQLTTAETYRIMANMIEAGVDRPTLEEERRELSKMPPIIFRYKAQLINHTEFSDDGQVAIVTVSQSEINQYSPLYNPGPLVQNDMLQTSGVRVAIVLKRYDDGKITAAIRCNPGAGVAAKLATHFGGGGHAFASGFKMHPTRTFEQVKEECLEQAKQLLADINSEQR